MAGRAYQPRFLWTWPNARISRDGRRAGGGRAGDGPARRDRAARAASWSAEEEAAFKRPTIEMFERQSHPLYASARLWDDGIIDPREHPRGAGAVAVGGAERAHRGDALRRVPDVRRAGRAVRHMPARPPTRGSSDPARAGSAERDGRARRSTACAGSSPTSATLEVDAMVNAATRACRAAAESTARSTAPPDERGCARRAARRGGCVPATPRRPGVRPAGPLVEPRGRAALAGRREGRGGGARVGLSPRARGGAAAGRASVGVPGDLDGHLRLSRPTGRQRSRCGP